MQQPRQRRQRAHRDDTTIIASQPGLAAAGEALEFGPFRILLRRRQLLANGTPIELGTRAFELLLALLEADGALVGKEELLAHVWPGIVVTEENLKVQVFALRKAFGGDRHFILTEHGRGYRFTAAVRRTFVSSECQPPMQPWFRSTGGRFPGPSAWRASHNRSIEGRFGRHCDPGRGMGVVSGRE
jgi:DNA-binding winged helix-turn-helix (wHTH) protein